MLIGTLTRLDQAVRTTDHAAEWLVCSTPLREACGATVSNGDRANSLSNVSVIQRGSRRRAACICTMRGYESDHVRSLVREFK